MNESDRMVQIPESRLRELQDQENLLKSNLGHFEPRDGQYRIGRYVLNTLEKWEKMESLAEIGRFVNQLPNGFTLSSGNFFMGDEWLCAGEVYDSPDVLTDRFQDVPTRSVEFKGELADVLRRANNEASAAHEKFKAACKAHREAELAK
jgi:hypothetical protein